MGGICVCVRVCVLFSVCILVCFSLVGFVSLSLQCSIMSENDAKTSPSNSAH